MAQADKTVPIMTDEEIIKTDLLIAGAGPAGAGLACFLAAHGETTPIASASTKSMLTATRT
jgi:2-polyprenyl-6-methoxyphenol hydroxylase-like FAD-dependent oxidoreductase